jgi:hypothetical protein
VRIYRVRIDNFRRLPSQASCGSSTLQGVQVHLPRRAHNPLLLESGLLVDCLTSFST